MLIPDNDYRGDSDITRIAHFEYTVTKDIMNIIQCLKPVYTKVSCPGLNQNIIRYKRVHGHAPPLHKKYDISLNRYKLPNTYSNLAKKRRPKHLIDICKKIINDYEERYGKAS